MGITGRGKAEPIISFITENDEEFKKFLSDASEHISDFRIPFGLIANHWYRGNKKLFTLKSEGLYPPLGGFNYTAKTRFRGANVTRRYKAETLKKEEVGFAYPLLKRRGDLEKSLISKNSKGAEYFVGRQSMVLGTSIEYAKYHQSDKPRKKIPQRKMVFIDGGPAERAKDAIISGRIEAWTNIVADYVAQVLSRDAS